MAAPTYLRRATYGVGLQGVDITATGALDIESDGDAVTDLAVIERYGLADDTQGYANVIDCSGGAIILTLTAPTANGAKPYSRLALKRSDTNSGVTCTIQMSAGNFNFTGLDPALADAASFTMEPGEIVILEKRINSAQLFMVQGSIWQG